VVDKSSSKAGATTWRLNTAAADLYEDNPDLRGKKVKALVRLSPGPTWTASDGSSITGELEKTAGAPDKTAAPWALFKITRRSGKGILANVSYVQCVFTELDASQIPVRQDSQGRLPYRANYIFYRPR
jgi:hypothetical protein